MTYLAIQLKYSDLVTNTEVWEDSSAAKYWTEGFENTQ